jgi:hypothetical protein
VKYSLSCVCWTKFTAAVFDLGVTSRFIKIHCKKGPTSDVATAFWNLLIFYDDMAFTSMCWISASWIIVSLVSAVLRAQCSVGLAN